MLNSGGTIKTILSKKKKKKKKKILRKLMGTEFRGS